MLPTIESKISLDGLQYAYPKRIAMLFVIFLLLYETTTYIANDMIMPGMLQVVHSFNAPDTMVATSLTAYILGGASLQLFLGPLSDRFGRRPVMLAGAVFFLLCTIFISISQSMSTFILARFFQGMGLCFISVIGYAALQEIFSEMQAIRLISVMSNVSIVAPLAGPLLGSLVIMSFNWRSVFIVIAILAAMSLIGLYLYMPETIGVKKRDGSLVAHTSIRFSVVMQNYFALLKNKLFLSGAIALGLATAPVIAWIGTSPLILMDQAKLSVLQYGVWQVPIFAGIMLGNYLMRYFSFKVSVIKLVNIGSSILMAGLILTTLFTLLFAKHYLALVVGLSCYAIGLGFISAPLNRLTLFATIVPKGTASAVMSACLMILISLGNQIAGYIYTTKNNLYFALFCTACALSYAPFYSIIKNTNVTKVNNDK